MEVYPKKEWNHYTWPLSKLKKLEVGLKCFHLNLIKEILPDLSLSYPWLIFHTQTNTQQTYHLLPFWVHRRCWRRDFRTSLCLPFSAPALLILRKIIYIYLFSMAWKHVALKMNNKGKNHTCLICNPHKTLIEHLKCIFSNCKGKYSIITFTATLNSVFCYYGKMIWRPRPSSDNVLISE